MQKTARELLQGQQLQWIRPDDHIDKALQKMVQADLTSLPVVEVTEKATVGPIKGFVDVVDLVAFLATVGTRPLINPYGGEESRLLTTDDVVMLSYRSREFRITNTVEVSDFCKRNPLHKVNQNIPLKDLIAFFGKPHESVHRVAVVDDNHNLIGVITQSMLIRTIAKDLADAAQLRALKVDSLHCTPANEIATIASDVSAFEAFMKMHKEGVSSLAVVSKTGDICDNISATDLKGVVTDFKFLLLPVSDFLLQTRNRIIGKKKREGLVHCNRDNTMLDLINLTCMNGVHRLYALDDQGKPSGVISLTDMCRSLAQVLV